MDYHSLIDEETWAFIRRTGEAYPEDAVDLSVADQRRVYDAMCRVFHQAYPDRVAAQDLSADGVPVRVYTAGEPSCTVMYFHGGGFMVGGLESHDDVCAEICAQTGYRVVSVDYRLAPEHKHPAAFDDCWTAVQWADQHYEGAFVLVGDSAGGNLAACVAHHARGQIKSIFGQVLIYPGLSAGGDRDPALGSLAEHAEAPLLNRKDVLFYKDLRVDGEEPANDPTYAPLQDSDFSGLPPTVIVTAECDPLNDDGRDYHDRLQAAGVRVHWVDEPGLVHGYLRARSTVTRAADSFERISAAIETLGQGLWPYD